AYGLEAEKVELVDQPEVDKDAIRVCGPFEVASLGRYSVDRTIGPDSAASEQIARFCRSEESRTRQVVAGQTDHDVYDAMVNVVLGCGVAVTFHKVRLSWTGSLERSLEKKRMHKGRDTQAQLRPEPFIIGLECRPLRSPINALFDEESGAAHRNVLPFRILCVRPHSVRAPHVTAPDSGTDRIEFNPSEFASRA